MTNVEDIRRWHHEQKSFWSSMTKDEKKAHACIRLLLKKLENANGTKRN